MLTEDFIREEMVLLDALYINNSGGRILLNELILQLHQSGKNVFYLLDERVKGDYGYISVDKVLYLKNSLLERHRFYQKNRERFSTVLCFGNIPPTIRLQSRVYTYFHNSIYFFTSSEFSVKHRLILKAKSFFIRTLKNNTDSWWVQTEEMSNLFHKYWNIPPQNIEILPFFLTKKINEVNELNREKNSFLYISDGHPNKMHPQLLEALGDVHKIYPEVKLYLTISPQYPLLLGKIKRLQEEGLGVVNLGWCNQEVLDKVYRDSGFFIFPSNQESFGLGLIEAAQYNMKILAADLPYVHAVIAPSYKFKPENKAALAEAMILAIENELAPAKLLINSRINKMLEKLQ